MNLWWGAELGSELGKMTERYAHLAPEKLRAGTLNLLGFVEGQSGQNT